MLGLGLSLYLFEALQGGGHFSSGGPQLHVMIQAAGGKAREVGVGLQTVHLSTGREGERREEKEGGEGERKREERGRERGRRGGETEGEEERPERKRIMHIQLQSLP